MFCSVAFAQSVADLVLESVVTPDYETYLWDQEALCNVILETPVADSVTMNAYAKRAVIHMALIHVDSRNFVDDVEVTADSLDKNAQRLDDFFMTYFDRAKLSGNTNIPLISEVIKNLITFSIFPLLPQTFI